MHCIISSPLSALGCFPFLDWHLVIHIANIGIFSPTHGSLRIYSAACSPNLFQVNYLSQRATCRIWKISTQDLTIPPIWLTVSFLFCGISRLDSADLFLTSCTNNKPFTMRSLNEINRIASHWSGESRYHFCIVCVLLKWRVVLR